MIVDITTTGATLVANQLKILSDGVILRSQANLAASRTAPWSKRRIPAASRLLNVEEAVLLTEKIGSAVK